MIFNGNKNVNIGGNRADFAILTVSSLSMRKPISIQQFHLAKVLIKKGATVFNVFLLLLLFILSSLSRFLLNGRGLHLPVHSSKTYRKKLLCYEPLPFIDISKSIPMLKYCQHTYTFEQTIQCTHDRQIFQSTKYLFYCRYCFTDDLSSI